MIDIKKIVGYLGVGLMIFSVSPILYADSTNLNILPSNKFGSGVIKARHSTITTDPLTVESARYDLLPVCPPAGPTNCGDPNLVGRDADACPNHCRVTRDPETLELISGTSIISYSGTIKEAICPPGYSQVAQYNMQVEAKYPDSVTTFKLVKWIDYSSRFQPAALECFAHGTTELPEMVIQNASYTYYVLFTKPYCPSDTPKPTVGSIIEVPDEIFVGMNLYYRYNATSSIDRSYALYVHSQAEIPYSQEEICFKKDNNGNITDTYSSYVYKLRYVTCQTPVGRLYLTFEKAPVSLVCARSKTEWQDTEISPPAAETY